MRNWKQGVQSAQGKARIVWKTNSETQQVHYAEQWQPAFQVKSKREKRRRSVFAFQQELLEQLLL
jgi:hypothetical protein